MQGLFLSIFDFMDLQLLKGNWQGEYMYGDGYGPVQGHVCKFFLSIEETEDSIFFKGICLDIADSSMASDNTSTRSLQSTIQGSFENGHIAFVKEYPFRVAFTRNWKRSINEKKKGHTVNYTGNYNASKNEFAGT